MMLTHGPIRVVADAAVWMIENGAEIARVQEAAGELARAMGMMETECFALPTGVILTVIDGAGFTTTVVRRIHRRVLHLERLSLIEKGIRQARSEGWSLGEVWLRLREAAAAPGYPAWVVWLASGLAAGGFALFFDGNLWEGGAAFVLGALWAAVRWVLDRPSIPPVFTTTLGAFLVVAGSLVESRLWPFLRPEPIAIGALMLLVPGLALVNALRDLVAGELVSSQSRFAEVMLTGAAVAVGATAALAVRAGGLL
jgi:uncharacterized membrane protein YjjP (DUF1212 family)